jgi:predicted nucleic acid-binding Zn ribbon protein
MVCKYCGSKVDNDSQFCNKCGKRLGNSLKRKTKYREYIIGIISLVILGTILILYFNHNGSNINPKNASNHSQQTSSGNLTNSQLQQMYQQEQFQHSQYNYDEQQYRSCKNNSTFGSGCGSIPNSPPGYNHPYSTMQEYDYCMNQDPQYSCGFPPYP